MIAPSEAISPTRQAYVVDDDEPFRRSLLVLLESAGWKVQGFGSGRDFTDHD